MMLITIVKIYFKFKDDIFSSFKATDQVHKDLKTQEAYI
jgi:hypothetical protein